MGPDDLDSQARQRLAEIVGYLNFSSGVPDPRFLANLNALFAWLEGKPEPVEAGDQSNGSDLEPAWRALGRLIRASVDRLRGTSPAFRQLDQAEAVARLVFDKVLPAYRRHHRDLLFHQTDESLFQAFFIGRVCEAVLAEGGPWRQSRRIVQGALKRLNDYIGHRPVAVLEGEQKHQPYANEWVRPIPLYIAGAGVGAGRYHALIERALAILQATDPGLLEQAWLDPRLMDELALDPRSFDFDHPINRRPNHHFGGWDPHHIDNQGRYRRFVLQEVTLDALWSRTQQANDLPHDELLLEAAAVLACTMMMGSGITGSGPDCHDSSTTLATLLPSIAEYRDAFYEQFLGELSGAHAERLRSEAKRLRQPLGKARQDLNQALSRRRAEQLQHVHLARLFARMGSTEAASRQAGIVPVASVRMRCEIDCRLTAAHLRIDRGQLESAARLLPEIEDLLHRSIQCGAMVDPWNILGFAGHFSLFPAVENSIHDHRIDELIELVNDIFGLYARLEKEAAVAGSADLRKRLSESLRLLAQWWDQFASTEVGSVEGVSGRQTWESADQVAAAIAAWHEAGTAAGDLAFWRRHVERFHSPRAFALLAETLIDGRDPVASMALLMVWLSQAEQIPLAEGSHSFHKLALRWMEKLWQEREPGGSSDASAADRAVPPHERWPLTVKFFDYLEANADEYWQVPRLELVGESVEGERDEGDQEEGEASEGLFGAAYEDVTYRDTTDDGFEGEMLEGGTAPTDFELSLEAERISGRLAFLTTLARLWQTAAAASATGVAGQDRDEVLRAWGAEASQNSRQAVELLSTVHRYPIAMPRGTLEAMIEHDRRRGIKEALVERIIGACVEAADAGRFIAATVERHRPASDGGDWEIPARRALRAMFRAHRSGFRAAWSDLLEAFGRTPLLYVPTSRGGSPRRVLASRSVQRVLRRMLDYLPLMGMLTETYQLIGIIQDMEQKYPAGPGAITEFDRLFEIGCKGIARCLVVSSQGRTRRSPRRQDGDRWPDQQLVECLERATEPLLRRWLSHSRNIRISVLETVRDDDHWQELKRFIRKYGRDLFTQPFMNLGNLRAILDQGVDRYLASLAEESEGERPWRLLEDLDRRMPCDEAAGLLGLVIEAVVENYPEYVDYNSSTTQSDRGDMLYTLIDFLRLKASYERTAWNLRPVILAHEVMVREGHNEAAGIWHHAVAERSAALADGYLQRLERLSKKYGMRLRSVADRLGERFVQPLAIDRLCALVRPAAEELRRGRAGKCFRHLEREIARFTEEPSGVGFDVPSWLEALEDEAERVRAGTPDEEPLVVAGFHVPQVRLSLDEVRRQVETWKEDQG